MPQPRIILAFVLFAAAVLLPCRVTAQTAAPSPSTNWAKTYDGDVVGLSYSVGQTSDGGYIVGGDGGIFKLDSSGVVVWRTGVSGTNPNCFVICTTSNAPFKALSVAQVSSGGYIAAGYLAITGCGTLCGGLAAWVAEFDASGARLWLNTYAPPVGLQVANSVAVTSDGGFVVAGRTDIANPQNPQGVSTEGWVLKLDSSGNTLWQKAYGLSSGVASFFGEFNSEKQTSDGGYIVAGETNSFGAGSSDVWVLKLDSLGGVTWQNAYGGPGFDTATSVQQTTDGGYIVAGQTGSFGAGGSDAWVLKLDSLGNVVWQNAYGGSGIDSVNSVQQTPDGGYIVAGQTNSFGPGSTNGWVFKLNSDGSLAWQNTYGGNRSNSFSSIGLTSDGGYVAAGATNSFHGKTNNTWILKLDGTGNIASCREIAPSSALVTGTSAVVTPTTATTSAPSNVSLSGFLSITVGPTALPRTVTVCG